jgi:hypothetical protein
MKELSDKLTALDATYREGLWAIYEEYNTVLATMSPSMTPAQYQRLWTAYEEAQRKQDALYEKMLAEWEALYAERSIYRCL